jgi:ribose 5-phosphate isomerase B
MRILIASDHAGYDLKTELIRALPDIKFEDLGPSSKDSVDYPDFADEVGRRVNADPSLRGILICGSGQGMAMRANKYPKVRAALVWNDEVTGLSRTHNDANVLSLAARFHTLDEAKRWTKLFIETPFEGGRHAGRVAKIGKELP